MSTGIWAGAAAKTWTEPATGMQFVAVPKGCFQMGSAKPVPPPADSYWAQIGFAKSLSEDEVPQHEVCVDAFWMGKFEVRIKEWQQIMATADAPGDGKDLPAAKVTWAQARDFAERLSTRSGGKYRFRLPTEAEWEYACLAGRKYKFEPRPDPQELNKVAWYQFRTPKPSVVGALKANAFGLHDMQGNVWEWVGDGYLADGYTRHALYNPRVEADTGPRVIRGGSFRTELEQTRCAKRGHYPADDALDSIGLRLVREQ
ncbi:MAG TPA: formylglycine-generating enzyme family protein [Novimethylophilus sp.]|jgi:formylglycine-generating enzyme required for sulfatase activity|uniref:formylglycine-generating enzyme family protein n=1 Tax=Novimethylophilus sp. TaxID=2137426 RepID=UPI002F42121C